MVTINCLSYLFSFRAANLWKRLQADPAKQSNPIDFLDVHVYVNTIFAFISWLSSPLAKGYTVV